MNATPTPPGSLWTVEEACRNAYPAREITVEGWLLRAAGGRSRRTNSVNPLRGGPEDPTDALPRLTAATAAMGRPLVFRVPDFLRGTAAALDRLGFVETGRNRTLWAPVSGFPTEHDAGVRIGDRPDRDWFAAWAALNPGVTPADVSAFEASVTALILPAGFAIRHAGGRPAALAYAALHGNLLVLEAVVTRAELRREGHGRALVRALGAWAAQQGATGACLQVAADNAAALALYRGLGFAQDLYDYRYFAATQP